MTPPAPHCMPPDIADPSKHVIVDHSCCVIEQALKKIDFYDERSLLRDLRILYTTAKTKKKYNFKNKKKPIHHLKALSTKTCHHKEKPNIKTTRY
jgi:hypothetical protein